MLRRNYGKPILTACPACGADLSGKNTSQHFYAEHLPEDFGLSPLGTTEAGLR